jgi:PTS system nitrogen regulatory IIA component
MQYELRDVAKMLGVPESQVYHWINEGNLPAKQVNGMYRFERAELLEWATLRRIPFSAEMFNEPGRTNGCAGGLCDALELGGIAYGLEASDKRSALNAVVAAMPLPEQFDRSSLVELFLAREAMGSTAVGDGVAIPHPRHPVILPVGRPQLTICFLNQPIDFGASDKRPVHTLFVVISPTISGHLQLLAKLAHLLQDATFREILHRRGAKPEILGAVTRIDRALQPGTPTDGKPVNGKAAEGKHSALAAASV